MRWHYSFLLISFGRFAFLLFFFFLFRSSKYFSISLCVSNETKIKIIFLQHQNGFIWFDKNRKNDEETFIISMPTARRNMKYSNIWPFHTYNTSNNTLPRTPHFIPTIQHCYIKNELFHMANGRPVADRNKPKNEKSSGFGTEGNRPTLRTAVEDEYATLTILKISFVERHKYPSHTHGAPLQLWLRLPRPVIIARNPLRLCKNSKSRKTTLRIIFYFRMPMDGFVAKQAPTIDVVSISTGPDRDREHIGAETRGAVAKRKYERWLWKALSHNISTFIINSFLQGCCWARPDPRRLGKSFWLGPSKKKLFRYWKKILPFSVASRRGWRR